jgi:hypothetical protein
MGASSLVLLVNQTSWIKAALFTFCPDYSVASLPVYFQFLNIIIIIFFFPVLGFPKFSEFLWIFSNFLNLH